MRMLTFVLFASISFKMSGFSYKKQLNIKPKTCDLDLCACVNMIFILLSLAN